MVDSNIDSFIQIESSSMMANISSIPVFESKLDFIPKVTIAIPTYKRANLLKEAIDSALSQQDYNNYDVIVVDNNPERYDETEQLLSSYNDQRLSYYKNEQNLGAFGNWNRLYILAKGEWIVMLHDDDLLYEDYLSTVFKIIMPKSNYDVYFPAFFIQDMLTNISLKERKKTIMAGFEIKERDFLHGNVIGAPIGMCIKKDVWKSVGGFSEEFYPSIDYEFYIRVIEKYKIIKFYKYPLGIYRILGNDSCKTKTILNIIKIDSLIKQKILNKQSFLFTCIWQIYLCAYAPYCLLSMKRCFHNKEVRVHFTIKEILCLPIMIIMRFLYKIKIKYSKILFEI